MNSPTQLNLASQQELQQRLTIVANPPREGKTEPTLELKIAGSHQNCIVLSVEEARALSLAIITVVNKQERHAHIKRSISELQPPAR